MREWNRHGKTAFRSRNRETVCEANGETSSEAVMPVVRGGPECPVTVLQQVLDDPTKAARCNCKDVAGEVGAQPWSYCTAWESADV